MQRIKILMTAALLILPLGFLSAQQWLEMWREEPGKYTFQEIKAEYDKYFETHEKERGTGYKQFERWMYYMEPRVGEQGEWQNPQSLTWNNYRTYLKDRTFAADQTNKTSSTNGSWSFFGSQDHVRGNSGYNGGIGRINVIAFHPTNSNIIFAGAPAGGLWKTTNGGSSWAPLTDGFAFWGVSGICVDPNNANIIYILTGDGDGGSSRSSGVWKTTNGGTTWSATGLFWDASTTSRNGYKLLMDPNNSSVLYAVESNDVHKTTNGGTTWSIITSGVSGSFRDMEFKPGTPSTMYLSTTNLVYRSTNSGSTWVQELSVSGANRIALGVSPANSNYVYALAGPNVGSGKFKGLYRSTNSGASFSLRTDTPNILGYSTSGSDNRQQSWYDLAIAVNPSNANEVHCAGIQSWKSTNGGSTLTNTSNWIESSAGSSYNHADIHELVYNGSTLFCGSDGGIYKTTNGASSWQDIGSGLAITEWYRFAGTPQNPNLFIGGAQDNGTNIVEAPIPDLVMRHVMGADGMEAAIDPTNFNIMYRTTQGGGLARSTNKGENWSGIAPTNLGGGPWVTPYILKPGQPTHILAGYQDVGISTNSGSTWTNLTSGTVASSGSCVALAYAPSNTNYIYVVKSSKVFKSTNSGSTWSDITSGLPGGSYTYVAVNPTNPNHIFVTRSGYTANSKIFESTNGGSTWSNISGTNLPNVPANCVAYEPGTNDGIYIGTDAGVYHLNDALTDWIDFSDGLPFCRVMEMEINTSVGRLRAATYGRSLWESDLYTSNNCPPNVTLSGSVTGTQTFAAQDNLTSTQTLSTTANITYSAGTLITLNGGFNVPLGATFNAVMLGCSAREPRDINEISGVFEESTAQSEVEVSSQRLRDGFDIGNYPNPFRAHTWISFQLPAKAEVSMEIYDVTGQKVAVLMDGTAYEAGLHTLSYDGSALADGHYFLRFTAGDHVQSHRLNVVR